MTDHTGKDSGQGEHLFIDGGVELGRATKEINVETPPRKFAIDLSNDLAIPLLGIYPKDCTTKYRNTCSSMFMLF